MLFWSCMSTVIAGGVAKSQEMCEKIRKYHDAKHAIFHDMYQHQLDYRHRMDDLEV